MYRRSEYVTPAMHPTHDNDYKQFVREITGNQGSREFNAKLKDFYDSPPRVNNTTHEVSSLTDLLQSNFIVGEAHGNRSPKNFLITNMAKLKEAGFTTLFLEHLYYDDQQEMDDYLSKTDAVVPDDGLVLNHLGELDNGFRIAASKNLRHANPCDCQECRYLAEGNNFTALVNAAKQCGIRVVGLDTEYTYSEQLSDSHMDYMYGVPTGETIDNYRIKSMNYTAYKIIEREMKGREGKWVSLMGNRHTKCDESVPGVAEMTGAKTVLVNEEKDRSEIDIQFNQICEIIQKSAFSPRERKTSIPYDVMINMPKHTPAPQITGSPKVGVTGECSTHSVSVAPPQAGVHPDMGTQPNAKGGGHLPGDDSATHVALFKQAVNQATERYNQWYNLSYFDKLSDKKCQGYRGRAGFFTGILHTQKGLRYANEFNARIQTDSTSSIDELVSSTLAFLTEKNRNYNAHSYASFLIDALGQIPGLSYFNQLVSSKDRRYNKADIVKIRETLELENSSSEKNSHK